MVCVGFPFQCGYGGVVSLCSLKISGIKLVFSLYATIKMMHGPINIIYLIIFFRVIENTYFSIDSVTGSNIPG